MSSPRSLMARASLLVLVTLSMCAGFADSAPGAAGDQSTAYQIDAAHSGAITGTGIGAPLALAWSASLPGNVSYPIIANGVVVVTSQLDSDPMGFVVKAFNQAT